MATIAKQSPSGEGIAGGGRIDLWNYIVYHHPGVLERAFKKAPH
jgi:hypothetical protein